MNPNAYIHTVDVQRGARSTDVATGRESSIPSTILSSVRCLIEPLSSRKFETMIGRLKNPRYQITWGAEDIRDSDTVIFQGSAYIVAERWDDTLRPTSPYHTAILTGKP